MPTAVFNAWCTVSVFNFAVLTIRKFGPGQGQPLKPQLLLLLALTLQFHVRGNTRGIGGKRTLRDFSFAKT